MGTLDTLLAQAARVEYHLVVWAMPDLTFSLPSYSGWHTATRNLERDVSQL